MILHQQILQPKEGISLSWLALHVESLTSVLCNPISCNLIEITVPPPFHGPITNITDTPPHDLCAIIASDIQSHITGLRTRVATLPSGHSALGTQDYILVNSLDGTTPAILHTQDPVALYLADASGTLGSAERFRSATDLSAEGWAYWWEDAQRAFHKLTIAFMQQADIRVPQSIADAVKHY